MQLCLYKRFPCPFDCASRSKGGDVAVTSRMTHRRRVTMPREWTPKLAAQSSSALLASKIKTKILNTSSFFKVSLKTNNKALALALVAQKEKSRQMEAEMVRLQKYVQSLIFDLAIERHKKKQMVRLRSFTLRNPVLKGSKWSPPEGKLVSLLEIPNRIKVLSLPRWTWRPYPCGLMEE
uniref:Uncharacterized protein n=1 Tax=Denticeps clupeoides TaxID=299321 RepID=A0AAY4BNW6_9TELE